MALRGIPCADRFSHQYVCGLCCLQVLARLDSTNRPGTSCSASSSSVSLGQALFFSGKPKIGRREAHRRCKEVEQFRMATWHFMHNITCAISCTALALRTMMPVAVSSLGAPKACAGRQNGSIEDQFALCAQYVSWLQSFIIL